MTSLISDLIKKILFTFFALCILRLGLNIFLPFTSLEFINNTLNSTSNDVTNNGYFSNILNIVSSGGMRSFSVFSLGIMPYIMSTILYQLLKSFYKEFFEDVDNKFYIRSITLVFTLIQGFFFVFHHRNSLDYSLFGFILNYITIVGGSFFLIFISELINSKGFGSGFSLIIFSGIVSEIPSYFYELKYMYNSAVINDLMLVIISAFVLVSVYLIVLFEKSYLNIDALYPRRTAAMGPISSQKRIFLPLKINMAGVIPAIFASTFIILPISLINVGKKIFVDHEKILNVLNQVSTFFRADSYLYNIFLGLLMIFFCYFYTNNVAFNAKDFANNLKRSGCIIPGTRPGDDTANFLQKRVNNLTLLGAIYIVAITIMPNFITSYFAISYFIGGTSLLIMIGVINDLIDRIYQFSMNTSYDKITKK